MFKIGSEKGQALVVIALAAVGLFGFTALAVDGGMVFSDRRHAQNAADTAALAAALARIRAPITPPGNPDVAAFAAGLDRADSNGYAHDSDSIVEVHICDEPGVACLGLPTGANLSEYIQVKITSTVHLTFARIIGRPEVTHTVTAVARAKIGIPNSPLLNAAIAALSQHDQNAIWGNGNIFVDVNGAGVFSNSDHPCGFGTSGSAGNMTVDPDQSFQVVGDFCQSGNNILNGTQNNTATQMQSPTINLPAPTFTCSGNGSLSGHTLYPGNFPSMPNLPNGPVNFSAGNYCFSSNVSLTGNTQITFDPNVNIMITNGEFKIQTNLPVTCSPNMLVYLTGTATGMHFAGNTTYNCNGVTFFVEAGDVTWNGNSTNIFTAPGSGPYTNVLLYMPSGNSSALTVNGNSTSNFTGSIIAVESPVTVSGNNGTFALNSQIIGYTVQMAGNGNIVINYNPAQQYSQTDPTVIQLTQ